MTLFDSHSQFREKLAIWRIMELLPLYGPLAEGHVWRWFAVNIPMDLGTGGSREFTSDLDIIAKLSDFPKSSNWIYKTWEVKVSLLLKDGSARSLKAGKTNRTLTQLNAYKRFGSERTTLLDVYICEDGFLQNNPFPTKEVADLIIKKRAELKADGIGYQVLTFEHSNENDIDVGLFTPKNIQGKAIVDILHPYNFGHRQPFSNLTEELSDFFEKIGERPRKHFNQIVFCRNCKQLQLVDMRKIYECPSCRDNLIAQT